MTLDTPEWRLALAAVRAVYGCESEISRDRLKRLTDALDEFEAAYPDASEIAEAIEQGRNEP